MKQGDIVLIPFPFTDLSATKKRPALIISNESFNKERNLILIAISTKIGMIKHSKPINQSNLQEGKLNKPSFLRFHNMFIGEKRLIIKKIAKINKNYLKEAKKQLANYIV